MSLATEIIMRFGRMLKKVGWPRQSGSRPHSPIAARVISAASWAYLLVIITVTLLLRLAGDRWWPATLLLFGRRSYSLWPLIILIPAAVYLRRRMPWILSISAIIAVWLLMDLCIPWRRALVHRQSNIRVRVLNLNVHGFDVPSDVLAHFVNQTNPDLLFLQDAQSRTLAEALKWGGWNTLHNGNSLLAVASRYPIRETGNLTSSIWRFPIVATQYEVDTGHGKLQVFNVHLESPHDAFNSALAGDGNAAALIQANSSIRLMQAMLLAAKAQSTTDPVIIAGDFDTPADSPLWRQAFGHHFTDAFEVGGFGFGWTYDHGPSRSRIDHIVMGNGWECRACWVGPDLGSSHRPVIADLQWNAPASMGP